jgi:hypothetical protein
MKNSKNSWKNDDPLEFNCISEYKEQPITLTTPAWTLHSKSNSFWDKEYIFIWKIDNKNCIAYDVNYDADDAESSITPIDGKTIIQYVEWEEEGQPWTCIDGTDKTKTFRNSEGNTSWELTDKTMEE